MNDYDKAGRYVVKREPAGFFRWLLRNPGLVFHASIDSRRIALPNQTDLTNDLVATVSGDKELEGICLELEAEARADALTRLLGYLARFWTEPGTRDSLPVSGVRAERLFTDVRDRTHIGTLTLTFATLAQCEAVWKRGLRGWNMETSPFLDEIRARVRAESRAEGQVEGRIVEARAMVLRLGRDKFAKAPNKKQRKVLEDISDLGQLESLAGRLLHVDSWAELLNGHST